VRRGEMPIVRRIPVRRIDAVEDADDVFRARAKDAVEAEAAGRRLNLLRVARAHRGDERRVVDPALQKRNPTPVFHAIDREELPPEIQPRQPSGVEQSLEREVVDGEDYRYAAEHRMSGVERF